MTDKPDSEEAQAIRKALAFMRDAAAKTNVRNPDPNGEITFEVDERALGQIRKLEHLRSKKGLGE